MNGIVIEYNMNIIYNSLFSCIKDSISSSRTKNSIVNEEKKTSAVFSYIEENINLLLNLSLNFKDTTFESSMSVVSKHVFINYISTIAHYFMKYLDNHINLETMEKKIVVIYMLCKKCVEFGADCFQNNTVFVFLEAYSFCKYKVKIECLIDNVINTKGVLKVDFDGNISNLYLFS